MSKVVDERVVEMRFDNKHFESNVSTTMSSLDKLKQKLNFTGATKGLEDVGSAAKKVDMTGLGNGVEAVRVKFSALQVMGVTALANITNSAVNAGKRIVESLTVAPVADGFSEYEMTLNAVQTTMAGTGKTAKEVQDELKKLDEYADKTVYSTADMLNNLPKFTNAGVELEKATTAMIGIANATALAGGDAGKASIAFYNLGQAIGTGYLTRMDYNSINNAGIATMEWKNQMVEAAIAAGTLKKAGDDLYEAGGKTFTLQQLFIDGLQHQWATTDVMMKVFGDYGDETTAIGEKAYSAAQDIKTFTMMMDSLKATAGTGWKDTWQIIFGDLDEAKELWTGLANFISGIITKMADFRNNILAGALNITEPWTAIVEKLEGSGFGKIKKVVESVDEVTDKLKYFQDVVNKVWRGDYNNVGDNPDRYDLLKAAGYDHRVVQDLVNKGYKYKLTIEDIEASHKKFGLTMENTTEETEKTTVAFGKLTDEQLKQAGLTEDEISLYRALEQEADRLGISISDLTDEMSKNDGRSLLIDSFKNLGDVLTGTATVIKNAWVEIFDPPGVGELAVKLYGAIKSLNEFTEKLRFTNKETGELSDTAKKLQRVFAGVFAIIDIIATILGGGLKIALKVVGEFLSYFGLTVLDVAAMVGDAAVKFRDWVDGILDFTKVFDKIVPPIKDAIKAFRSWIDTLKESENLPQDIAKDIVRGLGRAVDFIRSLFSELISGITNGFSEIPGFMTSGLVGGILDGIKLVGQVMIELGKIILEKICEVLGIESPSTAFIAIGGFIIAGLIVGLLSANPGLWETIREIGGKLISGMVTSIKDGASNLWSAIRNIGSSALDVLKNVWSNIIGWISKLDPGALLAAGLGVGMLITVNKIVDVIDKFSAPFEGLSNMFTGLGEMFEGIGDSFKANALKKKSKAVLNMALAIAILAGAVYMLAQLDSDQLWRAVGAVGVLLAMVAALAGLVVALDWLSGKLNAGGGLSVKHTLLIVGIAGSLLLLAYAVKLLSAIGDDDLSSTLKVVAGMLLGLVGVAVAVGLLTKTENSLSGVGGMLLKMSLALLLMVGVIKLIGMLTESEIERGIFVIALFGIFVGMMALVTKNSDKHASKAGGMMMKMSIALLMMVGVMKLAGQLKKSEINRGIVVMGALGLFCAAMIAVSKMAGEHATKAGGMLLLMSLALMIMLVVIKQISRLDDSEIKRGLGVVAALELLFMGLIAVSKLAGKHALQAGAMLLLMSGALLVLTGIIFMLSKMDPRGLTQGLAAVTVLELLTIGLIAVTKNIPEKCIGTLVMLTIIITLLVASVIGLSLLDPVAIGTASAALSAIVGTFALLISVTQFLKAGEKTWKRNVATMAALALIVAALGHVIKELAECDPASALGAATALSTLMISLATAFYIIRESKSLRKGSLLPIIKSMGVLLIAVAALAAVLWAMSTLNVENAIPNAIALSIIATVMTALTVVLSKVGKHADAAVKGAVGLTAMALPLAAFAWVLSGMPSDLADKADSVKALAQVMTAMTALLVPLTLIGKFLGGGILPGVAGLVAMAASLWVFATVLDMIPDVAHTVETVKLLTQLMTAMTLLLIPLAIIGTLAGSGAIMGVFALTTMVIPLRAFCLVLNGLPDVTGAAGNVKLLTQIMYSMTSLLVPLTLIGLLAPAAMAGMGALTTLGGVMLAFGVFAAAIGALMTWIPELQTFLDTGISVLEQLAHGLGSVIGSFITGFGEEVMSSLPRLGECLSQFIDSAMPFIEGVKMVDETVCAGVRSLAEAIVVLTAADLITGIASFMSGGLSLGTLGTELSAFMNNAQDFITGAAAIDPAMIEGVKMIADTVLILTAANVIEGLTSWLTGGSSLENFGAQLGTLGTSLAQFSSNVGTFTDEQVATVKCAAEAIKTLAQASSEIPNTGGLLAAIVGENDLGVFASQFPILGSGLAQFLSNIGTFTDEQAATVKCAAEAIKTLAQASSEIPNAGGLLGMLVGENDLGIFAAQFPILGSGLAQFLSNIGTFTDEQVATVKCAAEAIKTLAQASSEIPNTGGLLGQLVGENDLGAFASQFPILGSGLADFLSNLGTFTDEQLDTVDCAANAIKTLAAASASVPNSGGWIAAIVGDNDLGTFASQFPSVGEGISGFADKLGTFGEDKLLTVRAGISAINALSTLANADLSGAKKHIGDFGKKLVTFGSDLASFVSNMPSSESMTAATSNLRNLISAMKDIAAANVEGLKDFASSLGSFGKDAVTNFVEAFTSSTARSNVRKGASDLAAEAVLGIESKQDAIKEAVTTAVSNAANAISYYKDDFKSAGKDLGAGLVSGIKAKYLEVYAAAYALGQKAVRGEKDGQASNSPSKLTIQAGKWLGEGLIIGMGDMTRKVYNSGSELGKTATGIISSSISKIASVVDSDIDSQPTIRPVLDLSDVRAGVNAIGSMFGSTQSVGVLANVGTISSMMNQGQNGGNSDIISAIKDLKNSLSRTSGDTYNFDGITYDDGSNISSTVKAIVRAAKLERRV